MAGRDNDDIDDKYGGRGSETGSGNDAHRSPGESGQAEGAGYARRLFPEPDPDHPRSESEGTATGASRRRGPEDEIERLTPIIPDIRASPGPDVRPRVITCRGVERERRRAWAKVSGASSSSVRARA
jgi:hypothetical protein